jgi:Winged helix DNA-binding domain
MDTKEALAIRMAAQGLSRDRADVVRAARRSSGLQAQDLTASRLGLWARTEGIDQAAVARACDTERSVARSWLMRGTLHLVPSEDLRWMVGLFGPRTIKRYRRRRLELGLDDEVCRRAAEVIPEILEQRSLTRAELVKALAERMVAIDPSGQAPAHLLIYAACSGLVCRGPDRGDEPTYVRLDDWVGTGDPGPVGDAAVIELARRYFAAFSPATAGDFARWAGLPLRQAADATAAHDLRRVTIGADEFLLGWSGELATDVWRLLPAFDNYLLGHQSRDLALDPEFESRIYAGGGWIHPSVVHDGRVVGTWRRLRRKPSGTAVEVEIFEGDPTAAEPSLANEAAELGDFLGTVTELRVSGSRTGVGSPPGD